MKEIAVLLSFSLLLTSCVSNFVPTSATLTAVSTPTTESVTPIPVLTPTDKFVDGFPQCLAPIREFEYPLGEVSFDWPKPENLLPPQEWQKVINVPDASQLVLLQSRNNETELWVHKKTGGMVRYQFNGNQWMVGTQLSGPDYLNAQYFLDRDDNVWQARFNGLDNISGPLESLLSRYNEQTNQFEPVDLSLDNQDALGIRHVEVDSQGTIWFLAVDKAKYQLYSLDPNTMTVTRHLADYVLYPPFVISHNLLFIYAASFEEDLNPGYVLMKYAFDSGAVKNYYIPQRFYSYTFSPVSSGTLPNSLFVDSQQRVWLGTRAWIDLSSEDTYAWHVVVPNPIFIDVVPGPGTWTWGEPQINYETPDGLLWYNALRGTGWVDPKVGKWCVFTSYQSNVLADAQGNLWILADEWLYRRK
jgi:hypothetical protein